MGSLIGQRLPQTRYPSADLWGSEGSTLTDGHASAAADQPGIA